MDESLKPLGRNVLSSRFGISSSSSSSSRIADVESMSTTASTVLGNLCAAAASDPAAAAHRPEERSRVAERMSNADCCLRGLDAGGRMTQGSAPADGGFGAPANISITAREDTVPAAPALGRCIGVFDRSIRSSGSDCGNGTGGGGGILEVVDRPTPEPENSTFTVVAVAARAGPDFGTNFDGFERRVVSAATTGAEAFRGVGCPSRSGVLSSACDATTPPKNLDSGAIQPGPFVA